MARLLRILLGCVAAIVVQGGWFGFGFNIRGWVDLLYKANARNQGALVLRPLPDSAILRQAGRAVAGRSRQRTRSADPERALLSLPRSFVFLIRAADG